MVYLDDGVHSVQADRAEAASKFVQNTLDQTGLVAHPIKSKWTPSYYVSWLGFDIDLLGGAVLISKVVAITSLVSSALKQGTSSGEYYRKNHFLVPGWGASFLFYD